MVKIGDGKIKALYIGDSKIKKAYVGENLVFGETKPSRLPEGYTEVEYIHMSGSVGFNTNYRAMPSRIRLLFDIEMEAFSGSQEYIFYQSGTISGSSTFYYFLSRTSESGFRIMPGAAAGQYKTLPTGSVTGERINVDVDGPNKMVSISDFTSEGITFLGAAIQSKYIYIGSGTSTSKAPTSKLYSCKVYVSGELKFDFVPCTNSSGVAGLFDLVRSKFYANSFDGTVTAGPAV